MVHPQELTRFDNPRTFLHPTLSVLQANGNTTTYLHYLRHEYAANLSGGQKKLLELARTMMSDAIFILLDEPGAGVNPTLMQELVGHIQYLQGMGRTFLLIEHDMDLVMDMCDPVIVMSHGCTLMEGTPQQVRNDARVIEAYLGA